MKKILFTVSAILSLNCVYAKNDIEKNLNENAISICGNFANQFISTLELKITSQEKDVIEKKYNDMCLFDMSQRENIVSNIQFSSPLNEETRKMVLAHIPHMSASTIYSISDKLFKYIHPVFLQTKMQIPQDELIIARELSYKMKQRISQINIPQEFVKYPKKQRDIILIPYLEPFTKAKEGFQHLDSILYEYQKSIKVIIMLDKSKTKEEKSQLKFDKDECEISLTYTNNQDIEACKNLND